MSDHLRADPYLAIQGSSQALTGTVGFLSLSEICASRQRSFYAYPRGIPAQVLVQPNRHRLEFTLISRFIRFNITILILIVFIKQHHCLALPHTVTLSRTLSLPVLKWVLCPTPTPTPWHSNTYLTVFLNLLTTWLGCSCSLGKHRDSPRQIDSVLCHYVGVSIEPTYEWRSLG